LLKIPPAAGSGTLHRVKLADGNLLLLEVALPVGRQLIREALALHWAEGTLPPVEYRLFNPLIWLAEPLRGEADLDATDTGAPEIEPAPDHAAIAGLPWPSCRPARLTDRRRAPSGSPTSRARSLAPS